MAGRQWLTLFEQAGYTMSAPAWSLHDVSRDSIEESADLAEVGQLGLEQVLNHHRSLLKAKPVKPILVGHSMGRLKVQKAPQEDLAPAAVTVDYAPRKGVLLLSWLFLKSQWPTLSPFADRAAPLVMEQAPFAYSFANQQSKAVMKAAFASQVLPEARQMAKDTLTGLGAIDFTAARGHLMMISGARTTSSRQH